MTCLSGQCVAAPDAADDAGVPAPPVLGGQAGGMASSPDAGRAGAAGSAPSGAGRTGEITDPGCGCYVAVGAPALAGSRGWSFSWVLLILAGLLRPRRRRSAAEIAAHRTPGERG